MIVTKNDFGKGSKKRSDAAKKAARTRKRNAQRKNRTKSKDKVGKKKRVSLGHVSRNISAYIEKKLKDLIIDDMKDHLISNEAELQFSVLHHLKQFLNHYEKIRISSELPIRINSSDSDMRVDVVVSKVVHGFSEIAPLVAIELKESSELNDSELRKDIEKLLKLKKNRVIRFGYQIYICRSKYSEKELQDSANRYVKSEFVNSIIPIVINIYDHITGTEKIVFDKRWDQSRRYYHDIATAHVAVKTRKRRRKRSRKVK